MQNMKHLIDYIVAEKAQGNAFQELNYTMKLMLKGIPVKTITEETLPDPHMLNKIYEAAKELNVQLPTSAAK